MPTWPARLQGWATAGDTAALVLIGDLPVDVLQALPTGHTRRLHCDCLEQVGQLLGDQAQANRARAVLMMSDDTAELDGLLGLGCRLFPAGLLAVAPAHSPARSPALATRYFAFGFRQWAESTGVDGEHPALFEYSLSQYKRAPDWLNARHWANPERFDLAE